MDDRRFDTADLLRMRILDKPSPVTDAPTDRKGFDPRQFDDEYRMHWDAGGAREAIEAGQMVDVPEYYGVVLAWKDDAGYAVTG